MILQILLIIAILLSINTLHYLCIKIDYNKILNKLTKSRLLSEINEITQLGISLDVPFNNTDDDLGIRLSPMRNNLLEWHFSFVGIDGSIYEKGIYHGLIILPKEYPQKAPSIAMLTPNGRWEVGKFICLSASSHHQETWDSNWNLKTLVMSLRTFMTTQPREIGSCITTPARKGFLAIESHSFICSKCKTSHELLKDSSNYIVNNKLLNIKRKHNHTISSDVTSNNIYSNSNINSSKVHVNTKRKYDLINNLYQRLMKTKPMKLLFLSTLFLFLITKCFSSVMILNSSI